MRHCSYDPGTSGSSQASDGRLTDIPREVHEIHIQPERKILQMCSVRASPPVPLRGPSFFPLLPLSLLPPSKTCLEVISQNGPPAGFPSTCSRGSC